MSTPLRYEDRCCGRFASGSLGDSLLYADTTCTHDFFIVRIDRTTGQIDHVPNFNGPPLLVRMDVRDYEWKEGAPQ